ncbi:WYL domain-containing protein [Bacillus benzoevorans]|uniref:Putative DNA-binding transcriptional regulator YafY n=1 Tax=Bacillus benzoevorans TaxID=1456 RepID=A0A7X0HTD3_9BACI|nr:WYL domain-containing protein [Bacillus benzoevorans]MBB6446431.1 putative DNA-binding transcriptional regulator YafY [Bacillus benzoevorans]
MQNLLKRSLDESFPVEIIYQSKGNEFSKRRILVKAINETYLKAYCYKKKQARIFKIESILAVATIKEKREQYA